MCALVTGVQTYSLPSCLVHGAQPDAILLCHDPVRPHMRGLPHYAMPGLEETLEANQRVARRTNPGVRAGGIVPDTSELSSAEAHRMCGETSDALGLPFVKPFSKGVGPIINWINKSFEHSSSPASTG